MAQGRGSPEAPRRLRADPRKIGDRQDPGAMSFSEANRASSGRDDAPTLVWYTLLLLLYYSRAYS